jgi:hypothetical protein
MTLTANDDQSEPKPCKPFEKGMLLNAKFVTRLGACRACNGVVANLNRESQIKRITSSRIFGHRNTDG